MSHWKILKSQELFRSGIFRLRVDECELPDGRIMPRYYVMEFPDWVNVVPITTRGEMVVLRQYRHAADEHFLEIPGGSMALGEKDAQLAAERELLEETGYKAKSWVYCGYHCPNPALLNNKMHTFLALDCEKTSEPKLDPFEDLTVETMSIEQVFDLWSRGEIQHSLIAASLGLSLRPLHERGLISSVP